MLTYSELGKNGALGNQLWQIAGTVGCADGPLGMGAYFPHWFYEPYFKLDSIEFNDTYSTAVTDLAPNYLQQIDLWWDIRDFIRDQFAPTPLVEDHLEHYGNLKGTTAVHVRRANNLRLPDHHPVPDLEYFEFALDMFGLWGGDDTVLVFSDDLEWCKKQKCFRDARFADGIPPYVDVLELTQYAPLNIAEAAFDLHAMAKCSYHIISNSSFSWWGAFLADGYGVYYPERWYGPALKHIDVATDMMSHLDWEAL